MTTFSFLSSYIDKTLHWQVVGFLFVFFFQLYSVRNEFPGGLFKIPVSMDWRALNEGVF